MLIAPLLDFQLIAIKADSAIVRRDGSYRHPGKGRMTAVSGDDLFLVGWDDASFLKVPGRGLGHGKNADKVVPLMCHCPSRPFPGKKAGAE